MKAVSNNPHSSKKSPGNVPRVFGHVPRLDENVSVSRDFFGTAVFFILAIVIVYFLPQSKQGPEKMDAPSRASEFAPEEKLSSKVLENFKNLPLWFEVNAGQMDEEVKYISRAGENGLFLTDKEVVLVVKHDGSADSIIRMRLTGANLEVVPAGENKLEGKSNYFIGSDQKKWRTDISNFSRVRYKEIYPGVDMVFHGNQGRLEYDFIIQPGQDPRLIAMEFEGAENVAIDAQGKLRLKTPAGEVALEAPLIYQTVDGFRKPVSGGYQIKNGNVVGFRVGSYDRDEPLIIDPIILSFGFSTFLGGSGTDIAFGVTLDVSDSVYVTGRTSSTDFPVQGPQQGSLAGGSGSDVFITKFSSDGTGLLYSTYLGGSAFDEGLDIAVDVFGNAYVVGRTTSTDFPRQSASQFLIGDGTGTTTDAFVAKLNGPGNSLTYSTYLGGAGDEKGNGIVIDSSGSAYVTGETDSTDFPVLNPVQNAIGDGAGTTSDAFIAKFTLVGAKVYATYLGGSAVETGADIAIDTNRNVFITGSTTSTDFPTQSPFQSAIGDGSGTDSDAYVVKLNAAGTAWDWSTYLGGTGQDDGNGIAVDVLRNVYITGGTNSTDFPLQNAVQSTFGGGGLDAFATKLNPTGSALVYSTYYGGSSFDEGTSVLTDLNKNTYLAGRTDSTDFPVLNALQGSLSGGSATDVFVARLNSTGAQIIYSTYLGGSSSDQPAGITLDTESNIYVSGITSSLNFPTQTPFQSALSGGSGQDAFITKINFKETIPPFNSAFTVFNPFWQASPGIYTFMAVTHPSLEGMNPEIGVVATAILEDGSTFGSRAEFSVDAGQTKKMFIVRSDHPTLNPVSIPNAVFILGTSTARTGHVRFDPIATDPLTKISGGGYPNSTMLAYWGAVVFETTLTGFEVDFLGDLNHSAAHPGMAPGIFPSGVN